MRIRVICYLKRITFSIFRYIYKVDNNVKPSKYYLPHMSSSDIATLGSGSDAHILIPK